MNVTNKMMQEKGGFIIENKTPRTCDQIHKQIEGHLEFAKPGAVYECGKCHKQFTAKVIGAAVPRSMLEGQRLNPYISRG